MRLRRWRLRGVFARLARQCVSSSSPLSVDCLVQVGIVCGAASAPAPLSRTDLAPGPHTVGVELPGEPAREERVEVLLGEDASLDDPAFLENVADARATFAAADRDWEGGGVPAVVVGGMLLGLGVGVGVTSVLWALE